MKVHELRDHCLEAIAGDGRKATVLLEIPGEWPYKRKPRRMYGSVGPEGRPLHQTETGTICEFKAGEVLDFFRILAQFFNAKEG